MNDLDRTESYNCRVLNYPFGQHVTHYTKSINKGEKRETLNKANNTDKRDEKQEKHCKQTSLSRTKNVIYNIARSNTWDWFITITFDRTKTDSSEYDEVTKKLQRFLQDFHKRYAQNMKYLIVPELHKDKEHFHFHGLLSNVENMQFRFSGKFSKGIPIYNILNWSWGFTTATQVQDTEKVSSYITKYITKASEQYLKNKKRYYASRNIEKAQPEYYNIDKDEFLDMYSEEIKYCKSVNIPIAHQQITYFEI